MIEESGVPFKKSYFIVCALWFCLFLPSVSLGQDQPRVTADIKIKNGLIVSVIKPVRKAVLSFAQPGAIIMVPEEGQVVSKGSIIAKQDDKKLLIAVAEAETVVESARLNVETERHKRNKTERLIQEKILAPIALTEADFALKQSEAKLKIAQSKLNIAHLKLKECNLITPFSGVIVNVTANIGEKTIPGTPVVELVDLSLLKISVDIPMAATKGLKPGVTTPILIGKRQVGVARVKTILPLLDPASGLRRVLWAVRPTSDMLVGQYVTLSPWD